MSTAKSRTRAARSPRAATPKGGRPWYAPRPRWYVLADGLGAQLMRRERVPYNVRPLARCESLYTAERLAAALNREERYARWRREDLERLADACRAAEERRDALRRLVDAVCAARKPAPAFAKRAASRLAIAMIEAGRVLGDEPTFAPGGEPRGLKPAAQNRQRAARPVGNGRGAE